MSTYRPTSRFIPVSVYTTAGWVTGNASAPPLQSVLDFLNQSKSFIKLTAVTLPSSATLPFFALQRSAAILVIPTADEKMPPAVGTTSPRRVSILLETGVMTGTIDIITNLRVSDYLMKHSDFLGLRDCEIHVAASGPAVDMPTSFPLVIVNAQRIIGASEETGG